MRVEYFDFFENLFIAALYQAVLAGISESTVAVANLAIANQNTRISNSSGFFLSILLSVYKADYQLRQIVVGQNVSGATCLEETTTLGFIISQILVHKDDIIPGGTCYSLTGEGKRANTFQAEN